MKKIVTLILAATMGMPVMAMAGPAAVVAVPPSPVQDDQIKQLQLQIAFLQAKLQIAEQQRNDAADQSVQYGAAALQLKQLCGAPCQPPPHPSQ